MTLVLQGIDSSVYTNGISRIRKASVDDAKAIVSIYAPFVENTAVSFETVVPSEDEMASRIARTLQMFPWVVSESVGQSMPTPQVCTGPRLDANLVLPASQPAYAGHSAPIPTFPVAPPPPLNVSVGLWTQLRLGTPVRVLFRQ
jgi:hypothetical protein